MVISILHKFQRYVLEDQKTDKTIVFDAKDGWWLVGCFFFSFFFGTDRFAKGIR